MKLERILREVYSEPWLIRPQMHATICAIVEAHVNGTADHKAIAAEFEDQEEVELQMRDEVAVVPVHGVIGKGVSALEKSSGVTDVRDVEKMLSFCRQEQGISAVVLDINSPGGTVAGVPELADSIMALTADKPVFAHVDEMACSAAYWLASQCKMIAMDQSAIVGSIGVYLPIADQSERYRQQGVKMEIIKGGKFKGMGIPGTSLTDEQREQLQSRVDYIYGQFKAAVRRGRGKEVSDEDMQGQDFFGEQAKEAGLVDAIMSLDETVEEVKKYITK